MRTRSKFLIIFICVIAAILVMSVCIVPGMKGRVIDAQGKPIAGALVVYGYRGTVCQIVDSDVYHRPGTIIKTDMSGYFHIPRTIHFHTPLVKSKLSLEFYTIYDPQTHCAGIPPYNFYFEHCGIKVFKEKNWWFGYENKDGVELLIFHNVTDNPIEWYHSIKELQWPIEKYGWNTWDASAEDKRALLNHLLREYKEFKERHGTKECLYREGFVKSQFPVSPEEFKERKSFSQTYEEYKEAKDSFYKGKTWNEVISYNLRLIDDDISNLSNKPNYIYLPPEYW